MKLVTWPGSAEAPDRALLLLAHGRGEYGARYAPVAADLARRGIACAAFDFPGFGDAAGVRSHVDRFDEYVDALDAAVDAARAHSEAPLFLLAHSMGGLAAVRWAQTRDTGPVRGLVLSSPFLAMTDPLSPVVRGVVGLLAAVAPKKRFKSAGRRNTRDDAVADAYERDPKVVHHMTARWVREALRAQAAASAAADRLRLPLLVQQGGADTAADPAASRAFHDAAGSEDKTVHVYDGLLHEVLNELPDDRGRVLDDLATWVLARAVP